MLDQRSFVVFLKHRNDERRERETKFFVCLFIIYVFILGYFCSLAGNDRRQAKRMPSFINH